MNHTRIAILTNDKRQLIIITLIFSIAGVYYSYRQWMYFNDNPVDRYNLQPNLKSLINSYFVKADTWLYILIASSIALTIVLLFVILFRKRIVIAIALIKEGSKWVVEWMNEFVHYSLNCNLSIPQSRIRQHYDSFLPDYSLAHSSCCHRPFHLYVRQSCVGGRTRAHRD